MLFILCRFPLTKQSGENTTIACITSEKGREDELEDIACPYPALPSGNDKSLS